MRAEGPLAPGTVLRFVARGIERAATIAAVEAGHSLTLRSVQRSSVFGHALFVDAYDRGDGACRAPEVANGAAAEQQPRVAAAAAFVDIDELRPQIRKLRQSLPFEPFESSRRLLDRRLAARDRCARLLDALALQLLFDLELTKIA